MNQHLHRSFFTIYTSLKLKEQSTCIQLRQGGMLQIFGQLTLALLLRGLLLVVSGGYRVYKYWIPKDGPLDLSIKVRSIHPGFQKFITGFGKLFNFPERPDTYCSRCLCVRTSASDCSTATIDDNWRKVAVRIRRRGRRGLRHRYVHMPTATSEYLHSLTDKWIYQNLT